MYNELSRRYPKLFDKIDNLKQLNSDVNYNMEELLSNSKIKKSGVPDKNQRHKKQGIIDFGTRSVKFYDGTNAYTVEFSIAKLQNGQKIAYAKKYFGLDERLTKKKQAAESRRKQSPFNQQPVSIDNIPNSTKNVKSEISNDKNNDNSNQNPSFAVTSQMQKLRYNPEAYTKYVLRQFGAKNIDNERIAKKIKQIVVQDNKSTKVQEDTRQKVYERKGNLVGVLTLKERLINELAVEISESIEAH